jgi:hypothetical protein
MNSTLGTVLFLTTNIGSAGTTAMPPSFDINAAERFANLALAFVHKEYPSKISHNWPWLSILPAANALQLLSHALRARGEHLPEHGQYDIEFMIADRKVFRITLLKPYVQLFFCSPFTGLLQQIGYEV